MRFLKYTVAAAACVGALAAGGSAVGARGATFPDNDVNPPRSGVIIEDVMDVRQDRDRGRDSDVDVFNLGRASKCNSGIAADVNCD